MTYDKSPSELVDDRPITEAERAAIASTICPDCGDPKTPDRPLCAVCQRFQANEKPQPERSPWLDWLMIVVLAAVAGGVATCVCVQIVKARSVQVAP